MDKEIKEKLGIMNKEINYLRRKTDSIDTIVREIRQNMSDMWSSIMTEQGFDSPKGIK